ncbi:MAG TPA: hypothetical protein VMY40_02330 [Anaerolineae bacterium]|nr:hypothetical protein [Anaerolineae bacterium]
MEPVQDMNDAQLDAELDDLAGYFAHLERQGLEDSDYYSDALDRKYAIWAEQRARCRPEFPTYVGWDGREHAEF